MSNPHLRFSQLAFIVDDIADANHLVANMPRHVGAVLIDHQHDGLTQIASVLRTSGSLDAIHLFCHARPGELRLGSMSLDGGDLLRHVGDLSEMARVLSTRGELLLYGCEAGAGEAGRRLVAALGAILGRPVAAAIGLVGNHAEGGSWSLGCVHGEPRMQALAFPEFAGVLVADPASMHEVAFIIDDVASPEQLAHALPRHVFPIIVDHREDALLQLATALRGLGPLRAIHLFSHAARGRLSLGRLSLGRDNLASCQSSLDVIAAALSGGGDLLLYGCELAAGSEGAGFVELLAKRVRANVAASARVVGAEKLGGTWELDYRTAASSAKPLTVPEYGGVFGNGAVAFYVNGVVVTELHVGDTVEVRVVDTDGLNSVVINYKWTPPFSSTVYSSGTSNTLYIDSSYLNKQLQCHVTYTDELGGAEALDLFVWGSGVLPARVVSQHASIGGTEGASEILVTQAQLECTVEGYSASQILYSFNTVPSGVKLYKDPGTGVLERVYSSFTQAEVNSGALRFVADNPDFFGTVSLDLKVVTTDYKSQLASLSASIVIANVDDLPTGSVTMSGLAVQGETVSVASDTFQDIKDGEQAATRVYQWQRSSDGVSGWADISGAVGSSYVLGIDDGSQYVRLKVSFVDGGGKTETAYSGPTAQIVPNSPPTLAANNTLTINEDAGASEIGASLLSATDAEQPASSLIFTVGATPGHGTLMNGATPLGAGSTFTQNDIATHKISFTPTANFNGTDSFTFSVRDGAGGTIGTSTFAITVNSVNDLPTVDSNLGLVVNEDAAKTSLNGKLAVSDLDNPTTSLAYIVTSLPAHGTLYKNGVAAIVGTTFTQADLGADLIEYKPEPDYFGADSFGFSVSDGTDTRTGQSFSFTVNAVNDAPTVSTNGGLSINEDAVATSLKSSLAAADVDNVASELIFTISTLTTHGALTRNGTALSVGSTFTQADLTADLIKYAPDANYNGSDGFTFSVGDGADTLAGQSYAISVAAVNDTPTVDTNSGLTVNEDVSRTTLKGLLAVSDVDNATSALTYTVTALPAHGTLYKNGVAAIVGTTFTQADLAADLIEYQPTADYAGADSFGFSVTDGAATLTGQSFGFTVNPINDAPTVATNSGLSINEDAAATTLNGTLVVADIDNPTSALTYTVTALPTHGTLSKNGTALTVGGTFTQSDLASDLIKYAPDANYNGSDGFAFSVGDGADTLAGQSYAISVAAVNDTPTVDTNSGLTVNEDVARTTLKGLLAVSDVDNATSALTYTVTALPAHGTLYKNGVAAIVGTTFTQADLAADLIEYQPTADYAGADSFGFSVTDGAATLTGQSFGFTVNPINDAPTVATNSGLSINEDAAATTLNGTLVVADIDNPTSALTYTVTALPTHGTLSKNGTALTVGGTFTQSDLTSDLIKYAPDANYNGSDGFTFSVGDGADTLAGQSYAISVAAVNDAPTVATNSGLSINEDAAATTLNGTLVVADIDNPTSALTYTVTALPTHGTLSKNGTALTVGGTFTQSDLTSNLIKYAPDANYNGSDGFTFSVGDGADTLAGQSYAISVAAVNDAPTVATNSGLSINEDAAATTLNGTLVVADIDNPTSALTYTVTALPTHGTLSKNGTALTVGGTFTQSDLTSDLIKYAPDANYNGSDGFTFSVGDGADTLAGQSYAISVAAVNDTPTVDTNSGLTVNEDVARTTLKGLLAVSDVDNATSALTYTVTVPPAHGTLYKNGVAAIVGTTFTQADLAADLIEYQPAADYAGADSFGFSVTDGAATLTGQSFAFTVNPVNDAPTVATNSGLSINEDAAATTLKGLLAVSDVDNATSALTYTVTVLPAHGTLYKNGVAAIVGTTFTQADLAADLIEYQPAADYAGADSFGFSVTDGAATLTGQSFAFTVNPINDAPTVATNSGLSINEDAAATTLKGTLAVADIDNPTSALTYTVTALPTHGTLSKNGTALTVGGTFTQSDLASDLIKYAPDANYNGSDGFTFSVGDGADTLAGQSYAISVAAVNDTPTVDTNSGLTVNEDVARTTLKGLLAVSDVDNATSALTYTVTALPAHGTLYKNGVAAIVGTTFTQADLGADLIEYQPTADYAGADSFGFSVTDGAATLTGQSFGFTVNPINDAPTVATNSGLSINEDAAATTLNGTLVVADIDNPTSALTYTVTALPTHGTLSKNGTALTVGGTFTQSDLASDLIKYAPDANYNGSDGFTFSVGDGADTLAGQSYAISVAAVNDTPTVATNSGLSINEDAAATTLNGTLVVADIDNPTSALTYTVTALPTHGTLSKNGTALTVGGTFTQSDLTSDLIKYAPDANYNGSDGFTFSVGDGTDTLAGQSYAISVAAVNDAPTVATNSGLSINEDAAATTLNGTLVVADIDNPTSALTYTVTALPTHGTLSKNGTALTVGGTFTQSDLTSDLIKYAPDANYNGSDGFTFSVGDGADTLAGQSYAISVAAVNDTPTVDTNSGLTVNEDVARTTLKGLLAVSDVDNATSALTYTVTALPAHGTLYKNGVAAIVGTTFTQADLAADLIEYQPAADYAGADSFGFSVTDGAATLTGQSFAFTVNPVNDAPTVATNSGLSINEDAAATTLNGTLVVADIDNPTSALTYTVTALPTHGTLSKNGTALTVGGTFTQSDLASDLIKYAPDANYNGSDGFTFSVGDGADTLAGQSYAISVAAVNDTPTVDTNSGLTVNEDVARTTLKGLLAISDVDNATSALTYTVTALPAHGTLYKNGGAAIVGTTFTQADLGADLIEYQPTADYAGADSFGFSVTDGAATLTGQSFAFTVNPINDAPTVATNSGLSINEDAAATTLKGTLAVADIDNPTSALTYTVTALPTHGTLSKNGTALTVGGTFTQSELASDLIKYAPDANYNGSDGFTFSVGDGADTLAGQSYAISVAAVNDTPTVDTNSGLTVNEDVARTTLKGLLAVSDVDNATSALTYTVTALPAHGTLYKNGVAAIVGTTFTQADLAADLIEHKPDLNFAGSDSFGFDVTDGADPLTGQTFTFTVNPVNDKPTLSTNDGLTINEDAAKTSIGTKLVATDVDNLVTALTYTVTALPTHGTLTKGGAAVAVGTAFTQNDLDTNQIEYKPSLNYVGSDSFGFDVTDGSDPLTGQAFSFTVNAVNDKPTLSTNDGLTLDEDAAKTSLGTRLVAADVDNVVTDLTYKITVLPAHGTLTKGGVPVVAGTTTFTQNDLDTNQIEYKPDLNFAGTDSFGFEVTDGTDPLTGQTFTFTVNPVNDKPSLATNSGLTVNEDAISVSLGASLSAADIDNPVSALTYKITALPGHGTLEKAGVALAVNGTFTQHDLDTNQITFTPEANFNGSDSFTFALGDGIDELTGQSYAITVNPLNDLPTVDVNLGLTLREDDAATSLKGKLSVSDVDNPTAALSYKITALPVHGTLTKGGAPVIAGVTTFTQAELDADLIEYKPAADFSGPDSFGFSVSDGIASRSGQSFSISVSAVNDAPTVSVNAGLALNEDAPASSLNGALSSTDVDNTAASLTYTITSAPQHGTLAKNGVPLSAGASFTQSDLAADLVTFKPEANYAGADGFTFSLSDGTDILTGKDFSFAISAVNDLPTVDINTLLTVDENSAGVSLKGKLAVSDVDNPTSALVYKITALPAHGAVTLNGTPVAVDTIFTQADLDADLVQYQPAPSYNGSDSFGFSVGDGIGVKSGQVFAIGVTPINDLPTVTVTNPSPLQEDANEFTVSNTMLAATDPEQAAASLIYTLEASPALGVLSLSGAALTAGAHFSQADIDAGLLTYKPNANAHGTESLQLTLSDGGEGTVGPVVLAITINAVNDVPVGVPGIAGVTWTGSVLRATAGFTDADGIGTLQYQWQISDDGSAWRPIDGATSQSYTPSAGDTDKQLRVLVSYTDRDGTVEQLLSAATEKISEPPKAPPPPPPQTDSDNVDGSVEDMTPSAGGSGFGDGNGDGIPDSKQAYVTSLPVPVKEGQVFVTLENNKHLDQVAVHTVTPEAAPPLDLLLPAGLLGWGMDRVPEGQEITITSHVDAKDGFTGYWMQDRDGKWVNVAQNVVTANGKVSFQFTVVDGGPFDLDGIVNGKISLQGGPGNWSADHDHDGIPNAVELQVGNDPFKADNDVKNRTDLFVMQAYRDVFQREADKTTVTDLSTKIDTRTMTAPEVIDHLVKSQFELLEQVPALYFATFGKPMEKDAIDKWVAQAGDKPLGQVFLTSPEFTDAYASKTDEAFVDQLYQNALQRGSDPEGRQFWLDRLHDGIQRTDVVQAFASSLQFKDEYAARVDMAALYADVLGRLPDKAGLDFWTSVKMSGVSNVEIIGALLDSPEYHTRFL